jgi:hypothetical protein
MIQRLNAGDFFYPVNVSEPDLRIEKGHRITELSLNWADEIGLLTDEDQRDHFKAAACGCFATLGFPSASDDYLQIISDLNCAVFITDDACDGDAPSHVRPDRRSVDGISTTVAVFEKPWDDSFLSDTLPLRPAMQNIGERLLAKGVPASWRSRFAADLKKWLEAVQEEERFKVGGRVPTPSEMMTIRPASGAVFLFMNCIELALGITMPDAVLESGPLATLRVLASRIILYPHDVFSYQKEIAKGHNMNLITSLTHHSGMSLDEALLRVVRLHNEEMRNFDELARSIERREPARSTLRSYLLGLRYYMHGLFAWQWIAARYSKDYFFDAPT